MDPRPAFPIRVVFYQEGDPAEEEFYEDPDELASSLEFFDSDEDPEEAGVFDRYGRAVRLKVEERELVTLELM